MYTTQQLLELYDGFTKDNNFNYHPNGLYEPVRHIMNIKGKRIRPLLLLMACDLFGGDVNEALNAAYAIEVFHNFTLVHDDVMDHAEMRRGVETVHKKYGLNEAILAGDVMLTYAYKYLLNIPKPASINALAVFNKTSIEIIEGQQMDLAFEEETDVSVAEYVKMITYKTSVLLAASLQIGAIAANATIEDQEMLYEFGLNLGLSFQIKDDWLDTFGNGDKVGKKIGGDIIQNKKTYLLITALNDADKEQRSLLLKLLDERDEDKKVDGMMKLYGELNISIKTKNKIEEYYLRSLQALELVRQPAERKKELHSLAESLHNRDH